MTAITIENDLRARRHLRLARGSVVLAVALGLCAPGVVSPPAVADTVDDDAVPFELHLSAGARGAMAPGSATTASLTVANESTSRLTAGRVTVEVNRTPLADDASISSWLDDAEARGSFDEIGSDATTPVDPESTVTTSVFIPAADLADLSPGVYPMRARLTGVSAEGGDDVSSTETSTTVLVVTEGATAPVVVFVPLTATPADGALLTAEELTVLTAPDGALTAALDGIAGTSAVLAVDPSILTAVRALGSTAPTTALEWLERLDALPNERFALQFGDADAATQAQAGLSQLLQPPTFAPFLNPNDFAQQTPATPTPTPTETATAAPANASDASGGTDTSGDSDSSGDTDPEPSEEPAPSDGPVLPDAETLTALDGATAGILWPRSDVSEADLATFDSYLGEGATTILSSSAVEGEVGARAAVGEHAVLVTDGALSGALSKAASADDAAVRQRWLAEASAHLFIDGQSSPSAPLLVGLSRDETRTSEALREAISSVDSVGAGLATLLASTVTPATLTTEPDTSRATSLQRMLDSEVVLAQFATILDDPQLLLSPKRIQVMRATAVGLSADGFSEAVARVDEATRTTLRAVDIPPASTIQLLSANADLPFSVRNDLPWPVNIRLSVFPSDPRLDVQSVTEQTIQAGTTSRVRVPVSARVGSGEVNLRLELSSPTGVQIGTPETVRVSVRAEWETIGLVVFGGLIVLLLGLGIIRTVRRKRRESTTETDAGEPTAATSTGSSTTTTGESE